MAPMDILLFLLSMAATEDFLLLTLFLSLPFFFLWVEGAISMTEISSPPKVGSSSSISLAASKFEVSVGAGVVTRAATRALGVAAVVEEEAAATAAAAFS